MSKGYIVGVDGHGKWKTYKVVQIVVKDITDIDVKRSRATEDALVNAICSGKIEIANARVDDNGKLVGYPASLNRFENKINQPCVVVSEIRNINGMVLGYRVIKGDGMVYNITKQDLLKYCENVSRAGGIPIQNAKYCSPTRDTEGHIKQYNDGDFSIEVIDNSYRGKRVTGKENNGNKQPTKGDKLNQMYSKEQLEVLTKAKADGLNIRVIANPELTANKMRILADAMRDGINPVRFNDNSFTELAMKFYITELKNGVDISDYVDNRFSVYQLMQLSLGKLSGIDISTYYNPSMNPTDMEEMRIRLEKGVWRQLGSSDGENWVSLA